MELWVFVFQGSGSMENDGSLVAEEAAEEAAPEKEGESSERGIDLFGHDSSE